MASNDILETDVWQLVQAIESCGKYAFLIGAGTSRPEPAGIKTASELIDQWQEECYVKSGAEVDFDSWVIDQESEEMDYDQSKYGFWFEKRHPTRGERRMRIEDLVKDANPTPAHITLASMMSEGYVPHVLTPNFDDLLFDAFYLFLESKPNLIDHRAVAPEFKLTRDDSTIVKLHGDYLYDNLQNTDSETEALEPGMEDVLQQTVAEYGLVVIGYGGADDSIMDPLLNSDISEYGIYWCVRDRNDVSPKVGELLENPNTYLIEIAGFLDIMEEFYNEIDSVELPEHDELVKRAEDRADLLEGALQESTGSTEEDGDGAFNQFLNNWAAQRAVEKEQYSHAIDLLNDFIEDNPEDPTALGNRGNVKSKMGDYEDAIKDFSKVIEIEPENPQGYYNLGNAQADLERFEDAIENYNKAIELDPNDFSSYINRGNCKANIEMHKEAIEDYSKAIDIDSESAMAYYNRGNAKAELGRHEDAIEDYDEAIEIGTEDPDVYQNRGSSKLELEQYEEAIEDFNTALEVDPEHVQSYLSSSIAKMKAGNPHDALGDLDELLERNPENHQIIVNRAECHILCGNYKSAEEDSRKAKEIAQTPSTIAEAQMLNLIARVSLDNDVGEEIGEFDELCNDEFSTTWDFTELETWVEDSSLPESKSEQIQELIELLKAHQAE